LLIFVGFSGWVWVQSDDNREPVTNNDKTPILALENVIASEFDTTGKLTRHFSSPRILHYHHQDNDTFDQPKITLLSDKNASWLVNAKHAHVNKKENMITFTDNVHIQQNTGKNAILITADAVDLHRDSLNSQYRGHVNMVQGGVHLTAEVANTVSSKAHTVEKIIALGDGTHVVHFSLPTKNHQAPLKATAKKIIYFPQKHIVILQGKASVTQGKNHYSAPKIEYNMATQHIVSEKDTMIVMSMKNKK